MNYSASTDVNPRKITTMRLLEMKQSGRKIVCLTAYDALISKILDEAGIYLILVGDSLGNIVQDELLRMLVARNYILNMIDRI